MSKTELEIRTEEISSRLVQLKSEIPSSVKLIVVTKTFPISDIEILYKLGVRDFGENRDEEGSIKSANLPEDTIWHFQGGIQSKKLKSIVRWSDFIHSLDSSQHAKKISELANSYGKVQNVFIQVNLDDDLRGENRSGVAPEQLLRFVEEIAALKAISIVGLMGVGPLGRDPRPGFELLQKLSQKLQEVVPRASFISAGMSNDYQIAIECGATHVRLGSSILGSR